MNVISKLIAEMAIKEFGAEIMMSGAMLVSVVAPDVDVPEYVAFGNMIEFFCDTAIKVAGAVVAFLLIKKLRMGIKTKEWEYINQKKKANEEGIIAKVEELIQTIKDKDK